MGSERTKERIGRWMDKTLDVVGPVIGIVLLVVVVAPWFCVWWVYRKVTGRRTDDFLGLSDATWGIR